MNYDVGGQSENRVQIEHVVKDYHVRTQGNSNQKQGKSEPLNQMVRSQQGKGNIVVVSVRQHKFRIVVVIIRIKVSTWNEPINVRVLVDNSND